MHDAADLLADDAQIADLLLQNDGLGDNSISGGLTVTCDRLSINTRSMRRPLVVVGERINFEDKKEDTE